MKTESPVPGIVRFLMTHQLENFLIVPDFIAYRYADRKNLSNFLVRKLWGVQGVSWTIRSQKDLEIAEKEGYLPIFEAFRAE